MAFNPASIFTNSLFLRVLMTAIMAPAGIWIFWYGGRPLAAMVGFVSIMLIFEWTRIVHQNEFTKSFYTLSATAVTAVFLAASGLYTYALLVCLLSAIVSGSLKAIARRAWYWPVLGIICLILPCISIIWIRNDFVQGQSLIFILIIAVWLTDMGGYIWGNILGGPKLAPQISPAKTWSGAIGGVVMAMLACMVFGYFFTDSWSLIFLAAAAFCLSLASILGDILESALKRRFGIKDSGGYIPGHGGALDRVDRLLLATLVMATGLLLNIAFIHQN